MAADVVLGVGGYVSGPIVLAVGPERGLSQLARQQLLEAGFQPQSLGRRRLRAETAAITLLSVVGRELRTGGSGYQAPVPGNDQIP